MADTKIGATEADKNYTTANAGLSILSSIGSAYANINAYEAQIKAETEAGISNMNNIMDSFEYQSYKLEEDYNLLDSKFADKVSERMLQQMKDTATMKAMSAETGTTGGSTAEAVNQAKMDEMFDLAIINSSRTTALSGILRTKESARMNAVNQFKSLASGGINYKANILTAGLGGASNAIGNLLATMPNSVRTEVFGFQTAESELAKGNREQALLFDEQWGGTY